MRLYPIIFVFTLILFSCTNPEAKIPNQKEENLYSTTDEDIEMNLAVDSASNTFALFEQAYTNNKFDSGSLYIKIRFPIETGNEHIWLNDIEQRNGTFYGISNDVPVSIKNATLGDTIEVNRNFISDWMYTRNGKLIGGYTIKLIRKRMSEDERKQFDLEMPFEIED